MRRHIADDAHAFVTDVTSAYAQINIQGPRSRELMQMVTSADMAPTAVANESMKRRLAS